MENVGQELLFPVIVEQNGHYQRIRRARKPLNPGLQGILLRDQEMIRENVFFGGSPGSFQPQPLPARLGGLDWSITFFIYVRF